MQNWEEIQGRLKEAGQGGQSQQSNNKPEITSAEAGINTLEDLMNVGSVGYSRSDPTLWFINGQRVRINPELYQAKVDMSQAWHYSEAYQNKTGMSREEWTEDYLKNYNAGTLPPHPQGMSTVGGQTSYTWVLPDGSQTTTTDLTPPPELQGTHWQTGGYKPPQVGVTPTQPTTGQPTPLPVSQWQTPTTGQPITEQSISGGQTPIGGFNLPFGKPPMMPYLPADIAPIGTVRYNPLHPTPSVTDFDIGSPNYQAWDKISGGISLPSSTFAQNRFSGMTTGWDNPYYKKLFKKSRWGT